VSISALCFASAFMPSAGVEDGVAPGVAVPGGVLAGGFPVVTSLSPPLASSVVDPLHATANAATIPITSLRIEARRMHAARRGSPRRKFGGCM
jgi:hypothetical protein